MEEGSKTDVILFADDRPGQYKNSIICNNDLYLINKLKYIQDISFLYFD